MLTPVQPLGQRSPRAVVELIPEPYLVYMVRSLMEADPDLSFVRAYEQAQQRMGRAA